MDFIEFIRNRRSNRKFDGQSVSKEKLDLILEAGLRSPTGNNFSETEFILIEDKETLLYLAHLRKVATRMLETAGAAIVVVADKQKSNLWIEDASIAMAYMHLTASALGLGSCWVQMMTRTDVDDNDLEEVLRKRFNVPLNMGVLAVLAIGNINENEKKGMRNNINCERVHFEEF